MNNKFVYINENKIESAIRPSHQPKQPQPPTQQAPNLQQPKKITKLKKTNQQKFIESDSETAKFIMFEIRRIRSSENSLCLLSVLLSRFSKQVSHFSKSDNESYSNDSKQTSNQLANEELIISSIQLFLLNMKSIIFSETLKLIQFLDFKLSLNLNILNFEMIKKSNQTKKDNFLFYSDYLILHLIFDLYSSSIPFFLPNILSTYHPVVFLSVLVQTDCFDQPIFQNPLKIDRIYYEKSTNISSNAVFLNKADLIGPLKQIYKYVKSKKCPICTKLLNDFQFFLFPNLSFENLTENLGNNEIVDISSQNSDSIKYLISLTKNDTKSDTEKENDHLMISEPKCYDEEFEYNENCKKSISSTIYIFYSKVIQKIRKKKVDIKEATVDIPVVKTISEANLNRLKKNFSLFSNVNYEFAPKLAISKDLLFFSILCLAMGVIVMLSWKCTKVV